MTLAYSRICSPGGRQYNQDSTSGRAEGGKACFVVCDGLGAYIGSSIASSICAQSLCDMFIERGEPTEKSIAELTHDVHMLILDEKSANGRIEGACTTFAGLFTDGTRTIIAHIGDSRVYRFRGDKVRFCTADHSVAQMDVERGALTRRDLRYHRDQNKLTRVLGGKRYFPPDVREVDEPLIPGDSFLLCTDGFWEYVGEEEIEKALLAGGSCESILGEMERLLLSVAPANHDNYTAVLVRILGEDGK